MSGGRAARGAGVPARVRPGGTGTPGRAGAGGAPLLVVLALPASASTFYVNNQSSSCSNSGPGTLRGGIYFYRVQAAEGTVSGRFAIVH